MNVIGWTLVDAVSRALERDEREAALGDMIEAGAGSWRALPDVVGLVVRRQILLWKSWRPWLAAFAVTLPSSMLLLGVSFSFSRAWQQFVSPLSLKVSGTPVELSLPYLLCHLGLLVGWSWTAGFVVVRMSRRTVWASAVLSVLPCVLCLTRFNAQSMSRLSVLLFLPPAVWGAWRGLRTTKIKSSATIAIAAAITALTFATAGARSSWLINWVLGWPAWYLVATATIGAHKAEYKL